MDDQQIRNRIVEKMIRAGTGQDAHRRAAQRPILPIEGYGGRARANIRLVSVERAVEYLKDNDGNVPFGYD